MNPIKESEISGKVGSSATATLELPSSTAMAFFQQTPITQFPSRYSTTSVWRQEEDFVKGLGLGDLDPIAYIKNSARPVKVGHQHFKRAIKSLEDFPIPSSPEELFELFRFREWDIVAEKMLQKMRLRLLKGNAFQNFLVSIYCYEHAASICDECGLIEGGWCGKSLTLLELIQY